MNNRENTDEQRRLSKRTPRTLRLIEEILDDHIKGGLLFLLVAAAVILWVAPVIVSIVLRRRVSPLFVGHR